MTASPRHRSTAGPGGRLHLDPTICRGHGICAAEAPDLITLDEWGYPIVSDEPVSGSAAATARRAASLCPVLALRWSRS